MAERPMTCACIIIASQKRERLLNDIIIPSVLAIPFHEVVVVGDYHRGAGYRYLAVPSLSGTTNDALVKRDVGTLATSAEWLFYLSDDHAVRGVGTTPWHWLDIGVPTRFCTVEGVRLPLNMGMNPQDPNAPYCPGHAGLFNRKLIQLHPWSSQPHDRLWDLLSSRSLVAFGARLGCQIGWEIEDMETDAKPWL